MPRPRPSHFRPPGGDPGFVLIFVLMLLLGISILGMAMIRNTHQADATSRNHKHRIRAFYASDGIRTLLDQEILDGNHVRYLDTGGTGTLEGDLYHGAGGGISALRGAMGSPPAMTRTTDHLGSSWKDEQDYGVRWKGWLTAPATGSYTFLVRTSGQAAFHLSEDERVEGLAHSPIAWSHGASTAWPTGGPAVSERRTLKAGRRYYFELLHAQGAFPGFAQVGWTGPESRSERPIPGKRLRSAATEEAAWDTAEVGAGQVRYAVAEVEPLVFHVRTEAILGGPSDTAYRAPLSRTLSLRGEAGPAPDTSWERVLFYDFHADKSNPEFERKPDWGPKLGIHPGMVRSQGLRYVTEDASWFGRDSIGKPRLGTPAYNCGLDRWFTPWRPGWRFTYAYAGGPADCATTPTATDRAFHNAVFRDSLPFLRRPDLGANAYQFRRFSEPMEPHPGFTPLDGRGFGSEGRVDLAGTPHNYGFCMEMHTDFEHSSGLFLEFNGDDDVWLFLADSLVIDLGFVHASTSAVLDLDDLPLRYGQVYPLDFFYCERQSTGSSIDLITNLPLRVRAGRPRGNWNREYGERD